MDRSTPIEFLRIIPGFGFTIWNPWYPKIAIFSQVSKSVSKKAAENDADEKDISAAFAKHKTVMVGQRYVTERQEQHCKYLQNGFKDGYNNVEFLMGKS